jgi:uncharacterized protein with NAD-binding domain and iron-sulfur cluster
MGDVVFAPFYEVLKRRGVRFHFFHRLESVKLADPRTLAPGERPYVTALKFDVQAKILGGKEYHPLIDVKGLPCWPSVPDYGQLEDGTRLREAGWQFESHWDCRKADTITLARGHPRIRSGSARGQYWRNSPCVPGNPNARCALARHGREG